MEKVHGLQGLVQDLLVIERRRRVGWIDCRRVDLAEFFQLLLFAVSPTSSIPDNGIRE